MAESISILDSAMEFVLARLHLEGYRLERHSRSLVLQAAGVVAAGAVAMLGFVLVSVGAAFVLSQVWQSLAAALLAVGGVELVGGIVVGVLLARRSARRRLQGGLA